MYPFSRGWKSCLALLSPGMKDLDGGAVQWPLRHASVPPSVGGPRCAPRGGAPLKKREGPGTAGTAVPGSRARGPGAPATAKGLMFQGCALGRHSRGWYPLEPPEAVASIQAGDWAILHCRVSLPCVGNPSTLAFGDPLASLARATGLTEPLWHGGGRAPIPAQQDRGDQR